ncbi:PREDICTED: gibberellin-regulated protein 5-like [Ipomoea nil]|uniref:gibberellin-regulated protein 5-like n=1 Tax=Ipomoea nil TaxID=35883 RepID=UPI000901EAA2|nr:PREDICTED: gibberellin-regulated protein 5-like [Ipomoea nil]
MAVSSRIEYTFILFFVALLTVFDVSMAGPGFDAALVLKPPVGPTTCPVPANQCGSECNRRCSATSHQKSCLMFCNMCCNWCLCVPPGTYGNKECCSCYNDWKTQEGGPKCP